MNERKDSWSASDDSILATIILSHIRQGSTQLKAFDEVAERLARTSAACGFRWNATVRHQYPDAIREAKMARRTNAKVKVSSAASIQNNDFDVQFESCLAGILKLDKLYRDQAKEIESLRQNHQPQIVRETTSDIDLLMKLMNNARRMGLLEAQ